MEAANIAHSDIEFLPGCVGDKEMSEKPFKQLCIYELEGKIIQLEAEIDKWKTEVNRLYGVGQDIEADRMELQKQVEGFKEEVGKLKQHLSTEGEYSITRSDGESMSWESLVVSNIFLELDALLK